MLLHLATAVAVLFTSQGGPVVGPGTHALPLPPFWADLAVPSAYVRLRPRLDSPAVGLVRAGDRLLVTACEPACDDSRGWALLGLDGAIRLSNLEPAHGEPPADRYLHGTVLPGGAPIHAAPDPASEVLSTAPERWSLAFRPRPELEERGWLERVSGGYLAVARVRLERPSRLAGERDPALPLAFFRRAAKLWPEASGRPAEIVPKQARLPALGMGPKGRVRVPGGLVDRAAVRLAFRRERPSAVPPGARWVHVDLAEQVLTAYEGDTCVFTTLVSTGSRGRRETKPGIFRVAQKLRHGDMTSLEWDYHVEEVPHALFFHREQGFHGTFWHDRFGTPVSHGCVNLSLADAEWLFAWAPPRLPPGWHGVMPLAGQESLWVVVEKAHSGPLPDPLAPAS